ncbi:sugar-binding domain-containing protein [Saccharibacillus endophyticus]|uniref:beta-galactosidase n=1 Tax=Saccharibacillus endophyticus TaxID=2060666 RepID=A0ABQ1ZMR5_9BACL|nr:sugar-binding domain-containing protein [Saccharibacillus endophyticus]GGH69436.1 beta-galactosidase [Saccharibacillus endophyticus]
MIDLQSAARIRLNGSWNYVLDPEDVGETEQWYEQGLLQSKESPQTLNFPGTLTSNGIGTPYTWNGEMDKEAIRSLRQRHSYVGAAWYEIEVDVPADWQGSKGVVVLLERVMFQSSLWVNGSFAGRCDSLSVPHEYQADALIRTGQKNRITLRIDNRDVQRIGNYPSAYTDETQTIWNGVVGRMELQAYEKIRITDVHIFPHDDLRTVTVTGVCHNETDTELHAFIDLSAHVLGTDPDTVSQNDSPSAPSNRQERLVLPAQTQKTFSWSYDLGPNPLLWDEFRPNRYALKLELRANTETSQTRSSNQVFYAETVQSFALRRFLTDGRKLTINGRPVFLRGTLECCIFPLTGYPPTELEDWLKLMGTVKSYGLNHVRFHSWCPPEAAFEAADRLGVYLQVEGPAWMDTWNTPVGAHPEHYAYLPEEAHRIAKAYGNHPSFCIFSNGNELNGDFGLLHRIAEELRTSDNRHLYTLTTNWDRQPDPAEDLFCTQSVDGTGIRGQFYPDELADGTMLDFREAVVKRDMPVVAHEVGQYTVYPDVDTIADYSGALRAVNLEAIRGDLERRGLSGDVRKFVQSSGMLSLRLYRDEIEAALRTPEFGGFQLLDLHDFPGQSTATIGILDAFWQSKGLIEPEQFRAFCGPTVLLLRMPKRVYTAAEAFEAEIQIAHFGEKELPPSRLEWSIADRSGHVLDRGELNTQQIGFGSGIPLGRLQSDALNQVAQSTELRVAIELPEIKVRNEWSIWVYTQPRLGKEDHGATSEASGSEITITNDWNEETRQVLESGGSVLFLAHAAQLTHAVPGKFAPVFWSPVHFETDNPCGIWVDHAHGALAGFPTAGYAEHQWKDLLDRSVSLIAPKELPFEPIVQVIPNFFHNRKMTNLIEYRAGRGKLLICGMDIDSDLEQRPAAAQLRSSLLTYMNSGRFMPKTVLETEQLQELLRRK